MSVCVSGGGGGGTSTENLFVCFIVTVFVSPRYNYYYCCCYCCCCNYLFPLISSETRLGRYFWISDLSTTIVLVLTVKLERGNGERQEDDDSQLLGSV